jgi:hypothetical protein
VTLEPPALQARRVLRVFKEYPVRKAKSARRARKDRKGLLAVPVQRVIKAMSER